MLEQQVNVERKIIERLCPVCKQKRTHWCPECLDCKDCCECGKPRDNTKEPRRRR